MRKLGVNNMKPPQSWV